MIARRAFLLQLVRLPLVGGGVSLIGQPSAVAEPVTAELMLAYVAFLAREHDLAYREWSRLALAFPDDDVPRYWLPEHSLVAATVAARPAASRASLVLAAAGVGRH